MMYGINTAKGRDRVKCPYGRGWGGGGGAGNGVVVMTAGY